MPKLDPERVVWSRLEYSASKLGFKGYAEVRLKAQRSKLPSFDLVPVTRGRGLESRSASTVLLEIDARFGGKETEDLLWLDPASAAALQKVNRKEDGRKAYRFTDSGVAYVKRVKNGREKEKDQLPAPPGASPEQWPLVSQWFYPHSAAASEAAPVTEPLALLYLVSAGALTEPGQRIELRAFSRPAALPLRLEALGFEEIEAGYRERVGDRMRQREGAVRALRIAVRPGGGDFQFLGLDRDIEILVDAESLLPLLVRGKLRYFGRAEVCLEEVELLPGAEKVRPSAADSPDG